MASPSKIIRHPQDLSPYRRRVCELIAQGFTNEEIARKLGSNRNAIKALIFRTIVDTGLRNRYHLVGWYCATAYPVGTHEDPRHQIALTT